MEQYVLWSRGYKTFQSEGTLTIKQIQARKAPGSDSITREMITALKDTGKEKLTSLLNCRIQDVYHQIYPDHFSLQFQRQRGQHRTISF